MDMYDRINNLLKDKKISKRKLSIDLAIPYTTLASMFNRRSTSVDIEAIKKIAHYLHTDLDYIVSGTVYPDDLSDGEKIKLFRIEKNITQEKLAKLSGYSLDQIIDIENNKRKLSTDEAINFATLLLDDPVRFIIDEELENLLHSMPKNKSCVIISNEVSGISRHFVSKEQADILHNMAIEFNKIYQAEKNNKDKK